VAPQPPDLVIDASWIGDTARLRLAGEIDLSNSSRVNLEL
jgi:hypothetical protein